MPVSFNVNAISFDRMIKYFLPRNITDKLHPAYEQMVIIIGSLIGAIIAGICVLLPFYYYSAMQLEMYCSIVITAGCLITLFLIKYFGIYRSPAIIILLFSTLPIANLCIQTGGIFSPMLTSPVTLLFIAFWVLGRVCGVIMAVGNIILLYILCMYFTPENELRFKVLYMQIAFTVTLSVFCWFRLRRYEKLKALIKEQQEIRVSTLDRLVKERTEELSELRQNLALDFHDETGNTLSAISRLSATLKRRLSGQAEMTEIVDRIIHYSHHLYATSRDFLWGMNDNSNDPNELFDYLTSFGQQYYNQFNISFEAIPAVLPAAAQNPLLPLFASRHIVFIFKEAMTNAARHSGATHITFGMEISDSALSLWLQDNGAWKERADAARSYGMLNMEKRSNKNGFLYSIHPSETGTRVALHVPLCINK